MKYFEAEFTILPYSGDASDVLAALAGEAGFETFEETPTGLLGYVQQSLFSEDALREALADFPFSGVTVSYDLREAEDRDWNEQWEQEGFEPIVVEGGRDLVEDGKWKMEGDMTRSILIHDGRHLPADYSPSTPKPSSIEIEIDARQAFGTGNHETTHMICSVLLELNLEGQRVLDCGTGTGILSICALKLGAKGAVGYDIDEWSVDNARHNAVINQTDSRFTPLLGNADILKEVEGTFGLILANINRNILLADLPLFRQKLSPDGLLVLSGFYAADAPLLIRQAATLGLTLRQQREDNDWCCLVFNN